MRTKKGNSALATFRVSEDDLQWEAELLGNSSKSEFRRNAWLAALKRLASRAGRSQSTKRRGGK